MLYFFKGSSLLGGRDRRIGSGRILSRDVAWDYRPDKTEDRQDPDYNFRPAGGATNNYRDEKPSTYERRSNNYNNERPSRDYDSTREKDSYQNSRSSYGGERNNRYNNSRSNNSYNNRRNYNDGKEDEPEWFSAGPTSQHDTIDLHGFEEEKDRSHDKHVHEKEVGSGRKYDSSETSSNNKNDETKTIEGKLNSEFTKNLKPNDSNNNKDRENSVSGSFTRGNDSQMLGDVLGNKMEDGDDFNFEEFLNFDSITGLLSAVSIFSHFYIHSYIKFRSNTFLIFLIFLG